MPAPVIFRFMRADGTFDLQAMLHDSCSDCVGKPAFQRALDFLDEIDELTPIRKCESAAIAIACAINIARSA